MRSIQTVKSLVIAAVLSVSPLVAVGTVAAVGVLDTPSAEAMCFGSLGCKTENYTIRRNNNGYSFSGEGRRGNVRYENNTGFSYYH
jgi:hypothetical protein